MKNEETAIQERHRQPVAGLKPRQAELRLAVIALGERAFGPRWQTDLAAALSRETGLNVAQSQVANWISGRRPVPESHVPALRRMALRLSNELHARAKTIREEWGDAAGETPPSP